MDEDRADYADNDFKNQGFWFNESIKLQLGDGTFLGQKNIGFNVTKNIFRGRHGPVQPNSGPYDTPMWQTYPIVR
jgi:hypothetical protein